MMAIIHRIKDKLFPTKLALGDTIWIADPISARVYSTEHISQAHLVEGKYFTFNDLMKVDPELVKQVQDAIKDICNDKDSKSLMYDRLEARFPNVDIEVACLQLMVLSYL